MSYSSFSIVPPMSSRDSEVAAGIARLLSAGDGAALGLLVAVAAASSWCKYFYYSYALRRIRSAPSVPISGLPSLICSSDESKGEDAELLVVVRGRVEPRSAIETRLSWAGAKALMPRSSNDKAVAILDTQTCLYNEWRGIFGWSFDLRALVSRSWREQRSSLLRSVPFVLTEAGNGPNSGYVHVSLEGSRHPLPLTTVYHELHPIQPTPYTFFQAFFANGYPVALLDEEKILPVGKLITAVGICRLQDGGAIEIKPCQDLPCFLSDLTKDEIVTELNSDTKLLFWSSIALGTFSVGLLGYAIFRNWWRFKEWIERRQREEPRNEVLQEGTMEQENVPDGELCVVCLTARRRCAFIPCGHLVCCPRCAMSVERDSSPKCPVCRQNIRSSLRIYDS